MRKIRLFIGNFNGDDLWAGENDLKLIKPDFLGIKSTINNLDELFLYLAEESDMVILRKYPDREFLNYIEKLQVTIPEIYTVKNGDSDKALGKLILEDEDLLSQLKQKINEYKVKGYETELIPYIITYLEENIATVIGAAVKGQLNLIKLFNNKEATRELLINCGIKVPTGYICSSVSEFRSVSSQYLDKYDSIIIKELTGSGGSGLYIIHSKEQLNRFCNLYDSKKNRNKKVLIEKFYKVSESYNYQFFIRDGEVIPYTFSRQILIHGKIIGSFFDQPMTDINSLIKEHFEKAYPAAKYIAECGYKGIVGFDSILCADGNLLPVVDINCRINLSTIFHVIQKRYFKSKYAKFYCIETIAANDIPFKEILNRYNIDYYRPDKGEGMVILNANALTGNTKESKVKMGRFFIGLFYNDLIRLDEIYLQILKLQEQAKE